MRPSAILTVCCLALLGCSESGLSGAGPEQVGGEDTGPTIRVEPAELSFEALGVGCDTDTLVRISNIGTETLEVDVPSLVGEHAGEYTLDLDASFSLEPSESVEGLVSFVPAGDGLANASIFVTSNDIDRPELNVPLLGQAADGEWVMTDDFLQNEVSDVDVLFVIDNSSSMAPEQANVADNISGFFQWFQDLGVNYHMGVITTDVVQAGHAGELRGDPKFITPDTPNPAQQLATSVEVGEIDEGVESGLAALKLALSAPMVDGANAGFYREDAHLSVIILTDEPEQSNRRSQHYIDFLTNLKGDPSKVSVSAIVGDRGDGCQGQCPAGPTGAQPGDKYLDVQEAFPGVFQSICSCDFRPAMEAVGLTSAGILVSFGLSRVPSDFGRIEVRVDGELSSAWVYDQGANAVIFDTDSIPDGRSDIFISYPVVGGCP